MKLKNRNGLLEIYRLLFCFWVMHHHDFFFLENDGSAFSVAPLAVDFFFVLSGFFLIRSMRKKAETSPLLGAKEMMWGRLKPIFFSMVFIATFNGVCMALFIREDIWGVLFQIFCYWWYVLYLVIAIGVIYLLYRLAKNEKIFAIMLVVLAVSMGLFHYAMEEKDFFIQEFTYAARTFGCLSVGMLISYVPRWEMKKFNWNIPLVLLLIPTIFYFAYNEKTYWICLAMIGMFAALIYFTSNISLQGKFFDCVGQLSTRMYLYMSFVSMLCVLGLTQHRVLFVINVALAVMDLILATYRKKYETLKKAA